MLSVSPPPPPLGQLVAVQQAKAGPAATSRTHSRQCAETARWGDSCRALSRCASAAAVLLVAGHLRRGRRRLRRSRLLLASGQQDLATAPATGSSDDKRGLEAFLKAQREKPPKTDPLGEPLTNYSDNPIDLFFIAVFRIVMEGVAKWRSQRPFWGEDAYEGMLETAHAMQWRKSLAETQATSMAVIDGLLSEEAKKRFQRALKPDKFGTELNASITAVFFPFMVGKVDVESRGHEDLPSIPEGETWDCAVKIEKCRWLEKSGCVGMCAGLCKRPMEDMFGDVLGMPLSMEPDMEDLSCTMVFGKKPTPFEEDELKQQPCFATCAMASLAKDGQKPCHKLS
eukprot:TRINITY_DN22016_c0_g1_i1.p1 TRINITY_DN22016_c0_g1~~TRINITY_DN22016_c0_g1_i1.p1  ORF type:complete len:341 (+),score=76.61 TRINITY_DN22016_c0_g1_i1:62-1084(+)